MDLFLYIAVSFLVATAVTAVAVDGFRRGWLRINIGPQSEIAILKEKVRRLEIVLESVKEERNTLLGELVNANRQNSALEARVEEMEKKFREREKVRVLAIWPSSVGLNQKAERNAIYNAGVEYFALWGAHATKPHILRELRKNHYSILELGAHGLSDGTINLHDGEVLPGWWQRILSGRQVRGAVLLSCYSDSLADAMLRAGLQFVVATTGAIDDNTAIAFAKEFYNSYVDGVDVESSTSNARLILPLEQAEMIVLRTQERGT